MERTSCNDKFPQRVCWHWEPTLFTTRGRHSPVQLILTRSQWRSIELDTETADWFIFLLMCSSKYLALLVRTIPSKLTETLKKQTNKFSLKTLIRQLHTRVGSEHCDHSSHWLLSLLKSFLWAVKFYFALYVELFTSFKFNGIKKVAQKVPHYLV